MRRFDISKSTLKKTFRALELKTMKKCVLEWRKYKSAVRVRFYKFPKILPQFNLKETSDHTNFWPLNLMYNTWRSILGKVIVSLNLSPKKGKWCWKVHSGMWVCTNSHNMHNKRCSKFTQKDANNTSIHHQRYLSNPVPLISTITILYLRSCLLKPIHM